MLTSEVECGVALVFWEFILFIHNFGIGTWIFLILPYNFSC